MTIRNIMVFGVSMILAIVAVMIARNWLDENTQTVVVQNEVATANVVVATIPLYFGNTIRPEHLKVIEWPAEYVPEGTFQSVEALIGDGTEERFALKPIEINEPMLKSKLSGYGQRVSLSTIIKDGMRATTIRVNDVKGVGGFILPGDRVDVLLTRDQGKNDFINDVLLQNVKVLGIDQNSSEQGEEPLVVRAVTLETTPRQSQKLTLGEQLGNLSLALRNFTNVEAADTGTIRVSDLKFTGVNDPSSVTKPVKAPVRRRVSNTTSVKVVRALTSKNYTVAKDRTQTVLASDMSRLNAIATSSGPASANLTTSSVKPVTEFDNVGSSPPKNLVPGNLLEPDNR